MSALSVVSYVAGGNILPCRFVTPTNGTVILQTEYDYVNNKLKWFDMAGVQIANAVDLSTYTCRIFVTGK